MPPSRARLWLTLLLLSSLLVSLDDVTPDAVQFVAFFVLPVMLATWFCKKIRNQNGDWEPVDSYISTHTHAQFSHGMCEACGREHYPDLVN